MKTYQKKYLTDIVADLEKDFENYDCNVNYRLNKAPLIKLTCKNNEKDALFSSYECNLLTHYCNLYDLNFALSIRQQGSYLVKFVYIWHNQDNIR